MLHKLLTNPKRYLLICLVGMQPFLGVAQKVLYLPKNYYRPVDHPLEADAAKLVNTEWPAGKRDYWLVVSDRPDNAIYNKPNGFEIGKLDFKEQAWVTDQSGVWVQITQGIIEKDKINKPLKKGWIRKENLLLWPFCMIDIETEISKKAFLLNKVDEINKLVNLKDRSQVTVYNGPRSEKQIDNKAVYEVYFIYKREDNRVLLGAADYFSYDDVDASVVGWVDKYRITEWNQRLALECNHDEEAFMIRKSSDNKKIYGFKDQRSADHYSKTGTFSADDVYWDNDPVKLNPSLLSKSNPRRPVGDVFRFPVFKYTRSGWIRSGALAQIPTTSNDGKITGEINPNDLIALQGDLKKMLQRRDKLNVFFLVEATRELQPYRESILSAIDQMRDELPTTVQVKYGAAVYRDADLKTSGEHFKMRRLSPNRKNVLDFLNNEVFDQGIVLDPWTNFRWALNEVLLKGELSADEQNLIIVIGANADMSFNKARSRTAKPGDLIIDEKYYQLEEKLQQMEVNLAFIQVRNEEGNSYSRFAEDGRALMVNFAQKRYIEYAGQLNRYFKVQELKVPDLENNNEIEVNGVAFGYIKRAAKGSYLKSNDIADGVSKAVQKTHKRYAAAFDKLSSIVQGTEGGGEIDEAFAPIIWSVLDENLKKGGINRNAMSKIMDEKIKMYHTIFLPSTIKGLDLPYKTVVFMPNVELRSYLTQLDLLNRAMNASADVKRAQIYQVFVEMMSQLTGNKLSKDAIDKTSIDDLRLLMNGLKVEGYDLDEKIGFKIEDVTKKKVISDEALDKIARRLNQKRVALQEIYDMQGNYEYSYTVLNKKAVFFWISTDLLF